MAGIVQMFNLFYLHNMTGIASGLGGIHCPDHRHRGSIPRLPGEAQLLGLISDSL